MSATVNRVILMGRLGKDPEVKRSNREGAEFRVVSLSVATGESWNDKVSGERKERTEWHRVSILNDQVADVAEKYLNKGSKVYIEGKLRTRKWSDKDGQEHYITEVVIDKGRGSLKLLDTKSSRSSFNNSYSNNSSKEFDSKEFDEIEDAIPF